MERRQVEHRVAGQIVDHRPESLDIEPFDRRPDRERRQIFGDPEPLGDSVELLGALPFDLDTPRRAYLSAGLVIGGQRYPHLRVRVVHETQVGTVILIVDETCHVEEIASHPFDWERRHKEAQAPVWCVVEGPRHR